VHEPDAFVAWGGRGAVQLHERDHERFAMLLERVQPSTLAAVEDGDEVVTAAGRLNRRLAIPAPPDLPRLRNQADAWEERLRKDARELTHALPPRVLDAVLATVRELGPAQPDTLIHGDLHPGKHSPRRPRAVAGCRPQGLRRRSRVRQRRATEVPRIDAPQSGRPAQGCLSHPGCLRRGCRTRP
jgi:streptomycin 6-kinase